jgi:hypothetical protein
MLLYQIAVSIRNIIWLMTLDQQLARLANQPLSRARNKSWLTVWLAKGSLISSPASQNAAALLFDLGTVDIR